MARQKLIHIHSTVKDKIPEVNTLDYGEIAVNYNSLNSGLYIKSDNNTIVKFIPEENSSLKTDNKKLVESINEIFDNVVENSEVTATSILDLTEDKQDKTDNSLTTSDKTIVGAINEVKGQIDRGEGGSVTSVAGRTGAVVLNKSDVSLGNVDNTSDADKPISTLTQKALDLKVSKENGKGLSSNDFTTTLKTKLDGIANGAEVNVQADWNTTGDTSDSYIKNKPTIPSKLSQLSGDTSHRVVTDSEKTKWNAVSNKVDKVNGKGLSENDFTTTLKDKLDGIAAGAEVNTVDSVDGLTGAVNLSSKYAPKTHNHSASEITSGVFDIERIPHGAIERLVVVDNDEERFALTTSSVQKGDTVKVSASGLMYFVIDDAKLSSEAGYTIYTAGSATSVPWSGVTGKPGTFSPSSHTHSKSEITDFPTSMPASDVSAWAKKSTKPSYTTNEVNASNDKLYVSASEKTKWNAVTNKVDKVDGKGLSANDFTTTLKNKLDGIPTISTDGAANSLAKRDSSGSLYAKAYYETSDENLKNFKEDINIDFKCLKSLPKKYFTWKNKENSGLEIGTSAQEVQKYYPEIVNKDVNGNLTVDYAKLSIIALAAIDKLNERISELEQRLK